MGLINLIYPHVPQYVASGYSWVQHPVEFYGNLQRNPIYILNAESDVVDIGKSSSESWCEESGDIFTHEQRNIFGVNLNVEEESYSGTNKFEKMIWKQLRHRINNSGESVINATYLISDPVYRKMLLKMEAENLKILESLLYSLKSKKDFIQKIQFLELFFSKEKIANWILLFGADLFTLLDYFKENYEVLKIYLNSDGSINWESLEEIFDLEFDIYEMASLHTVAGVLEHLTIPEDNISISSNMNVPIEYLYFLENEYNVNLSRMDVDQQGEKKKFYITFVDGYIKALEINKNYLPNHPSKIRLSIPYRPFKLMAFNSRSMVLTKKHMRIPGSRPVIIASSPWPKHFHKLIRSYQTAFEGIPVEQKPLLIVGVRYYAPSWENACLEKGVSVAIREVGDKKFKGIWVAGGEKVTDKEVVLLATMGELAPLYSVADLAIVDHNRNLLEPAAFGVPTLYFDDGSWGINEVAKLILQTESAIEVIRTDQLEKQIVKALGKSRNKIEKKMKKALKRLNQNILADAVSFLELYLLSIFLEIDKNKNAMR